MSKVLGTSIEQVAENIFTAVIQFAERNVTKDFNSFELAQSWVESMTEHSTQTNVEGSTIDETIEPDTFNNLNNSDDSTASESEKTDITTTTPVNEPEVDNTESQA